MKQIVTKASGITEALDPVKLCHSLERAGLNSNESQAVCQQIVAALPAHVSSEAILKQTLRALGKRHKYVAARYDLKRAIMDLGPSGFPFEQYVAEILRAYGYEATVGQIVPGFCVSHEVDIVAKKDAKHVMVECKYHNYRGIASDLQVAMYTHARFMDLEGRWQEAESARRGREAHFHEVWLVTNTRCTADALTYAKCNNIKIISWGYPEKGSLEKLIEHKNLYPITLLPSVKKQVRDKLFQQQYYLVKQLANLDPILLDKSLRLGRNTAQKIVTEATELCEVQ